MKGEKILSQENAKRMTNLVRNSIEKVNETKALLMKTMVEIKELDDANTLTIPMLNKFFKQCFTEIEEQVKEYKKFENLFEVYEVYIAPADEIIWDDYFQAAHKCSSISADFQLIFEEYKHFTPKNKYEIEGEVRKKLLKKGFLVDSFFEGDYATWIGVYARPKDKPTYLDANTHEEYLLQEKYKVDGLKQDFSEWFEWRIEKGVLVE